MMVVYYLEADIAPMAADDAGVHYATSRHMPPIRYTPPPLLFCFAAIFYATKARHELLTLLSRADIFTLRAV